MHRTIRLVLACGFLVVLGSSEASAWGCDGHRAVVLIAERLLGNATMSRAHAVLMASPVDPDLQRFCGGFPSDRLVDAATWADDFRDVEPQTAAWHFIDFPRAFGAQTSIHKLFCAGGNCIIEAIVTQFRVLRTSTDPRLKANALRFIIHFVGDIHQPLHTITNGDRGGNCLPVTYFTQTPQQDANGNFRPNLHGVWDTESIRRLMITNGLTNAQEVANHVAGLGLPPAVAALTPNTTRVKGWARASNNLARMVTYGRLPVNPPMEPASAAFLASCTENNHVGERMAQLHETIDATYEQVSGPVILSQLRLAGIRLAATLKAAFPNP